MQPHVLYVAGPYSAPWRPWRKLANILRAIKAGVAIMRKGHIPWVPHSHTCLFWIYGWGTSWETYMKISLEQVMRCDWLLYLGPSKGADMELAAALSKGMTVFKSVDEIPPVDEE